LLITSTNTYLTLQRGADRLFGVEALGLQIGMSGTSFPFPCRHSTFHHLKAQGSWLWWVVQPFACLSTSSTSHPAVNQRPNWEDLFNAIYLCLAISDFDPDFLILPGLVLSAWVSSLVATCLVVESSRVAHPPDSIHCFQVPF